MHSSSRNSEFG